MNGYRILIKKNIIIILLLLYNYFIGYLAADYISPNDISLLDTKDKNLFLLKCSKDNEIISSPICLNFIGIKIYMKAYFDNEINKTRFTQLEKKSIKYLNLSAAEGSKKALKNLSWIYSNGRSTILDLSKSALFLKEFNRIKVENKTTKLKKEILINKKRKNNLANLELALVLIENLNAYYLVSKENKYEYISRKQFEEALSVLNKIIIKSNVSKKDVEELKKKIRDKNEIVLGFLREDLKYFSKKNKIEAEKILSKLESLIIH